MPISTPTPIPISDKFNFGYACLNTELRHQNIFTSRTLRLATLEEKGIGYVRSLSLQNLKDLQVMLEWNLKNDIKFMRLSSEMFPFASHPIHGYNLDFFKDQLKSIGDFAKQNKIRLTMHPGQYNVLSSPNENVILNTVRDLDHHADLMDAMGLDQNGVMIIHGGGVYNDKKASIKRLTDNIKLLKNGTRKRLVLENCEMAYTVEDLIPISLETHVPIVMDFHHDSINPSSLPIHNYFEEVLSVWKTRNIKPKVHISNSVPGITEKDNKTARRKHSDFIHHLHADLYKINMDIDVMLECKMKEQAILRLRGLEKPQIQIVKRVIKPKSKKSQKQQVEKILN